MQTPKMKRRGRTRALEYFRLVLRAFFAHYSSIMCENFVHFTTPDELQKCAPAVYTAAVIPSSFFFILYVSRNLKRTSTPRHRNVKQKEITKMLNPNWGQLRKTSFTIYTKTSSVQIKKHNLQFQPDQKLTRNWRSNKFVVYYNSWRRWIWLSM